MKFLTSKLANLKLLSKNASVFISSLVLIAATLFLLQSTTPQAVAQNSPELDIACIGEGLAKYMNAIIDGAGDLPNVKLLSPAFNITNTANELPIYDEMVNFGANFGGLDGYAGNSYRIGGTSAASFIGEWGGRLSNKPLYLTEWGESFSISSGQTAEQHYDTLILDYNELLQNSNISAINYFSPSGINPDPNFIQHTLSGGSYRQVVSRNTSLAGVNPGVVGSYQGPNLSSYKPFSWTVIIATGPDIGNTASAINAALADQVTPILRICLKDGDCGFVNPEDYVSFLTELSGLVNGTFYAIAGPNEPATELWATPDCVKPFEYVLREYSCDDASADPEYHSLRPYPVNPCNKNTTGTTMCSNDLMVKEVFRLNENQATGSCRDSGGGKIICPFTVRSTAEIEIDLSKADLPIVGNTELVPNATIAVNKLPYATRMNEYVSWYLNGVINRAEEPYFKVDNPASLNALINFSGPLRKLLPQAVQSIERFAQTDKIGDERHDQVVSCGNPESPQACPPGVRGEDNTSRISEIANKPIEFQHFSLGEILASGMDLPRLVFGEVISRIYESLRKTTDQPAFQYVPFSSTEDRQAPATATVTAPNQPRDGVQVSEVTFVPTGAPGGQKNLYFAHMQENSELSELLQQTFVPGGVDKQKPGDQSKTDEYNATIYCEIDDAKDNQGDSLYGDFEKEGVPKEPPIKGNLSYVAEFECELPPLECTNAGFCVRPPCEKEIFAGSQVFVMTPRVEETWTSLVSGSWSAVKRFFPKSGAGTPIEDELEDIPGKTTVSYKAAELQSSGGTHVSTEALAGDPGRGRPGENAQLFFPHLGSLQEYFLEGIQEALRPQGIGNTSSGVNNGAIGNCKPESMSAFGDQAKTASCIAQAESTCRPGALNNTCLNVGGTADYSVGLFQINLMWHPDSNPPELDRRIKEAGIPSGTRCFEAFTAKFGGTRGLSQNGTMVAACKIGNQKLIEICTDYFSDPQYNIEYAVREQSRNGWGPWATAGQCNAN